MITLLATLFLATDTLTRADSVTSQVRTDTLREVEVRADTSLRVMDAIQQSLERQKQQQVKAPPSLNDLLLRYAPGLHDRITHPFAIKERKREKKHKRDRKILRHYDQVKTFNDLLREAIEREGLEVPAPASSPAPLRGEEREQ